MWPARDYLALPKDVIAFAWSAPMRDLAARIGMSDVGLRKLLRAQGIVTPPQGHWNRAQAGRPVIAPPQPQPRRPGGSGRISLDARFRDHIAEAGAMPEEGPFTSKFITEDLAELRSVERAAIGKAPASRDLKRPPGGLVRLLKSEAARREKAAASRWPSAWDEPHFDTPLGQRRLRFLAGLFSALAKRGHNGEAWADNGELRASCSIGDTTLRLRFEIVGKHATEICGGHHRPARDLPAKTKLRLSLDRPLREPLTASWCDAADGAIEKQIADIAADLVVAGEATFRQSLIEAREHAEQMRVWEEHRRHERLVSLDKQRLTDLRTSGELLRQAEEIRALVLRVEQAMVRGETIESLSSERLQGWKTWALAQADKLDPVLSGQVLSHLHVAELDKG